MVIVNGENAAHGRGISQIISDSFFDAGVDVITMGNHVWNNKDIFDILMVRIPLSVLTDCVIVASEV